MSMGAKLRALRKAQNVTLQQAANAIQITKSSLAMYEADKRIPRDEVKVRIARYYGESVEFLFFN